MRSPPSPGKAIDQDGNYDDPEYGKISFSHLLNTLGRSGETVELTVLREGKEENHPRRPLASRPLARCQ